MSIKISIAATLPTLAEAVAALGWDLSYNEAEAGRKMRKIEAMASSGFYVTEDGRIFYVVECDTVLLNEFTQTDLFSSVIDSGLFRLAEITGNTISLSAPFLPRTNAVRQAVNGSGQMLSLASA